MLLEVGPELKAEKAIKKASDFLQSRLRIIRLCKSADNAKWSKIAVLYDQVIDSLIVAV
jgi:hypothetical protein